MRKRIDAYIPQAMDLVERDLLEDKAVKNIYNSYISNFGAAVVSSGIKATTAFFSKDEDHRKLLKLLYEIVTGKSADEDKPNEDINKYLDLEGDYNQKIAKLMDAAAAIKLSIRTFKINIENG